MLPEYSKALRFFGSGFLDAVHTAYGALYNITQSDVCTVLYQPKQTVNSALKKLESEGYITLTPAGAHTKNISLTKSGTKLCEQTVDKVIEAECAALGNMTDEESENMTALMKLYSVLLKNQTAKI